MQRESIWGGARESMYGIVVVVVRRSGRVV